MERSRCSPSLMPGQTTSWVWVWMPMSPRRCNWSSMLGMRGLPSSAGAAPVGGVHGDVEGREALLVDALPVALLEVGQGDEAAVKEGVAVVVVLDVEGRAQAGRVLVHEAERAVVVAALDAVEGRVDELEAEVLLLGLPDREDERRGKALAGHLQRQAAAHLVELVADHVLDGCAVDGRRRSPWAMPARRRGCRAQRYLLHRLI